MPEYRGKFISHKTELTTGLWSWLWRAVVFSLAVGLSCGLLLLPMLAWFARWLVGNIKIDGRALIFTGYATDLLPAFLACVLLTLAALCVLPPLAALPPVYFLYRVTRWMIVNSHLVANVR